MAWEGKCGASLIDDNIRLSAVHCNVISKDAALVGAHQSFSTVDNDAKFRTIVDRQIHPVYDSMTLEYNFLVLKLDQAVT